MVRVAVFGASGYTGLELIRVLLGHPDVKITLLGSETYADKNIAEVFPHFSSLTNIKFEKPTVTNLKKSKADLLFCALPHGVPMNNMNDYLKTGARVIDLSADFRIRDASVFEKWYNHKHTCTELLETAVYGLPELSRKEIKTACLVANPGCYPTSIALGLKPLLDKKLIKAESIIADSKSGVSGAGRSVKEDYLFTECGSDFRPYAITTHRHTPEIEQSISQIYGSSISITFTPHLLPISRGIISTIYASPEKECTKEKIDAAYNEHYSKEFFVRYSGNKSVPRVKSVAGTNFCDIGVHHNTRTDKLIIVSAIDNLGKGAAGQAVQNMNIMFSLPEKTGLNRGPLLL